MVRLFAAWYLSPRHPYPILTAACTKINIIKSPHKLIAGTFMVAYTNKKGYGLNPYLKD